MKNENAPWVKISEINQNGIAWRCTRIRHLSGADNAGRHNVFIYLYEGRAADRLPVQVYSGPAIRYGWEGQHPDELQQPKTLDKKPPDPTTDIAIETGMHVWIEVVDPRGYPSERVSNLHAEMPSDGSGNEYHHHSYAVEFILDDIDIDHGIDRPLPLTLEGLALQIVDLKIRMEKLEAK